MLQPYWVPGAAAVYQLLSEIFEEVARLIDRSGLA